MIREQDIRVITAIGTDVLVALKQKGGRAWTTFGALVHELRETLTPEDISVALGLLWGRGLVDLAAVESVRLTATGLERVTQHLAEQRELPKLEGGSE